MADEENVETPAEEQVDGAEVEHAVPTEEATEIASVVEDAPLEALQEAEEAAVEEAAAGEPAAQEEPVAGEPVDVAGEPVEQAPAAEDPAAEEPAAEAPIEEAATAAEEPAGEQADADGEDEEEPAPRVKPSVPGAHLEVDIVPEGVDPLGRSEGYEDPYAVEDDAEQTAGAGEEPEDEALAEPISTAAIDLASGARYRATGKRKTAIARVTLRPGSGSYLVNGRALEEHFPRVTLQRNIRQPLETVGYQERMDVVARLRGGGISAQAGALRHGVSRALLEADPNLRGELKRRGFLTRDSRAKERKKAGLKKARKRPQFSKR
jgi:small subunit ribosomal protein S9